MTMTFADDLTEGLRAWTASHDPHVRAAVELLIWHEFWLRRQDFRKACMTVDEDVWIRWREARAFVDSGPRASTSELAVLDLAVALGENRYRLSSMGSAHSRAIADAVAVACGFER
jgi:hypothetical protein